MPALIAIGCRSRAPAITDDEREWLWRLADIDPPPADCDTSRLAWEGADLPVDRRPEVEAWACLLLGPGRQYTDRWLARERELRPVVGPEIAGLEMPADLIWLAIAESGGDLQVTSRRGAVGLWQLMPTQAVDRTDPRQSTDMALLMLDDLHERFGDWRLAEAAYNAGPNAIRAARSGDEDFWTVAPRLSRETRNYVPKVMAMVAIGRSSN